MQYRWADGIMHQYYYSRSRKKPRVQTIARLRKDTQRYLKNPLILTAYFPGTEAIGYFDSDQRRIDKKLAGANLSVRDSMERVGDSNCYAIEGRTRFGWITACFDPQKDFALAKYTVEASSNDISRDNLTLAKAYKVRDVTRGLEVTIEKFTEVNGVWLPATVEVNGYTSFGGDFQGDFRKTRRIIKLDSWSVNPDFEALNAFEFTDIPDDSLWAYQDAPDIHYRWNGGDLRRVR